MQYLGKTVSQYHLAVSNVNFGFKEGDNDRYAHGSLSCCLFPSCPEYYPSAPHWKRALNAYYQLRNCSLDRYYVRDDCSSQKRGLENLAKNSVVFLIAIYKPSFAIYRRNMYSKIALCVSSVISFGFDTF